MTIFLQSLLPQHLLSTIAGKLADSRQVWLKNLLIKKFINHYRIDLQEAIVEKAEDYRSFNDFFTRQLKPELRPIVSGANEIASPVDGCIAQIGNANGRQLFQAKGFYFDLINLLGGDEEFSQDFNDTSFATLYLAPHNYHRIHMPIDGSLIKTIYVPGKLFSVNCKTAAAIPNLYSRNERLICIFSTRIGLIAVILVGALIVGSIQTIWMAEPIRQKTIRVETFTNVTLEKGAELGQFKLGSTVILLFPKNTMNWVDRYQPQTAIKYGELLGSIHLS